MIQFKKQKDFFFDIKPAESIVNDTNLLYCSINNGNECKFEVLENLSILEGKNYKFKLNPEKIIAQDIYFFKNIELLIKVRV